MTEKTVLIADDDADLVHMLTLRLRPLGVSVQRSFDAMHALLGIHGAKPDLIVLDVNMPGGNGLSVCEMLAGDEHLAKIPVIIMTGQKDDAVRQRCKTLGAHYVAKGASLWESLRPLISALLELSPPPVEPDLAAPRAEPTDEQPEGTPINKRPKVLCIDDDAEISKILKLRLEPYGLDVLRAFSGMQGFWTAIDMKPDVIITDLSMPDGEGNYIFGRLKMHPLTEKTPVYVLSGQANPAVKRQLLSMGVEAFLSKPPVLEELLDHLREHITLAEPQPGAGIYVCP